MSATTLPNPVRPTGGVTPHGVEPPRLAEWAPYAFLVLGFLIDFAQFSDVVGRAVTSLEDWQRYLIAAGAGAVALFMMFEAGHLEAQRRERTMGKQGKGLIRTLISVWGLLGLAATYIRLAAAPDSGGSGGFGSAGSDAVVTTWDLGPITLYSDEIPMALLMLILYVAVGLGAYLVGLRSHRPLLTDLRRARTAERKQQRKLRRLIRKRDKASARVSELTQTTKHLSAHNDQRVARTQAAVALEGYQSAEDLHRALEEELLVARQREAVLATEIPAVSSTRDAAHDSATAVGMSAKQHARVLLHRHLADPTRTVMDADVPHLRPTTEHSEV